jgi:hypothetical protein
MKVLIACESSGTVRDAFIARGHDAVSCDITRSDAPGPHIIGDVLDHLHEGWDMMIAHPPCTYLANSGVRWLYGGKGRVIDLDRWWDMVEACAFFRKLLDAQIPRIAIENPIIHGHAKRLIGQKQTQIIQPWQFGHGETKATCLWLKNLPRLEPTKIVAGRKARIHKMPPSPDRTKNRSITFKGIAAAMADRWGTD